MHDNYTLLCKAVSQARMQRYLDHARGGKSQATTLYAYYLALSEACYTPLHVLELVLRNAINHHCVKMAGEAWYKSDAFILNDMQAERVCKSTISLYWNSKLAIQRYACMV